VDRLDREVDDEVQAESQQQHSATSVRTPLPFACEDCLAVGTACLVDDSLLNIPGRATTCRRHASRARSRGGGCKTWNNSPSASRKVSRSSSSSCWCSRSTTCPGCGSIDADRVPEALLELLGHSAMVSSRTTRSSLVTTARSSSATRSSGSSGSSASCRSRRAGSDLLRPPLGMGRLVVVHPALGLATDRCRPSTTFSPCSWASA